MKVEDFGALETAKLLNGPFKTPHCSLRGSLQPLCIVRDELRPQENTVNKTNFTHFLFKGPRYSLIQLEVTEFDLRHTDHENRCHDFLEIRKHQLGQYGRRYCGTSLSRWTVTSKYNHLVLNLQTNIPVRTSKFKGKIKVILGTYILISVSYLSIHLPCQ
jgi:hypothetical protein